MVGKDSSWSSYESWWQPKGKGGSGYGGGGPKDAGSRPLYSLSEGEEVSGKVSNVTEFGVFVNIGCVKDGLVRGGEWSENVQPGDWLEGLIVSRVDLSRNRISLRFSSLEDGPDRDRGGEQRQAKGGGKRRGGRNRADATPLSDLAVGMDVKGKVVTIASNGVFLDIGAEVDGFLAWHSSSLQPEDVRLGGEISNLCVQTVNEDLQRVALRGPLMFSERENAWDGWTQGAWADTSWWQGWDGGGGGAGENDEGWWAEEDGEEGWQVPAQEHEEEASWELCEPGPLPAGPAQQQREQHPVHRDPPAPRPPPALQNAPASTQRVPPTPQPSPEPRGGHSQGDVEVSRSPPALAVAVGPSSDSRTRTELMEAVFEHFDANRDGRLTSAELRAFATLTGFDGQDEEWEEEYRLLCEEAVPPCKPTQGLSLVAFKRMVDDESEAGCYCTDKELLDMLPKPTAHNPTAQTSLTGSTADQPHSTSPVVADEEEAEKEEDHWAEEAEEEAAPPRTRQELVDRAFRALDADGDGRLKSAELRAFATHTGFSGSDEDWAAEYRLLCEQSKPPCSPGQGLDFVVFATLVDDTSDEGCHCTDEELLDLLKQLGSSASRSQGAVREPEPKTAATARAPVQAAQAKTAAPLAQASSEAAKGPGKGHGKDGGKRDGRQQQTSTAKPTSAGNDPWAAQADPWSMPSAKRATEQLKQKVAAAEAESAQSWDVYKETVGDPTKPAMDASKLLEASRAKIAERKAKIQEQEQEAERARRAEEAARAAMETSQPSSSSASSSGPKMVSMGVALASIGSTISRLTLGETTTHRELANLVLCSPCIPHALAVASNALRSVLQGRKEEAQCLLRVDELFFRPGDGDVALLGALSELSRALGSFGAPFLVRAMMAAMAKMDDKQCATRNAAAKATEEIAGANEPFAFEALLACLRSAMDPKRSPAMKLQALQVLSRCRQGKDGEAAVAQCLPELLPVAAQLLLDTNTEVRAAAGEAVWQLLELCGNADLEPHLDEVFGCYKGKDVSAFVQHLAEVVFVQRVEAPALAAVMPALTKGLKSRSMKTQRQACTIAANMCKLVSAVTDVKPFAPQLLPLLKRIHEEASDPDVRKVAGRAHDSLLQVSDSDEAGQVRFDLKTELALAASEVAACPNELDVPVAPPEAVRDAILDYVSLVCTGLGRGHVDKREEWQRRLLPLVQPLLGSSLAGRTVEKLRKVASRLAGSRQDPEEHASAKEANTAEAEDVFCDCTLTLACGAATLLSGARLRLARGHAYGLVGGNDSGKSTLLRAIHERRVVGFPPAGTLVTALVEHGVGEHPPECDYTPMEFLQAEPAIQASQFSPNYIKAALHEMGFNQGDRMKRPISTLSGGWRMKLNILRAMLQKPDLILLDEPTGHLDSTHREWLVDYVNDLKADKLRCVTTLVVSHDNSFLDSVCTDIIHVADSKLSPFAGNLSQFLQQVPGVQLGSGPVENKDQPIDAFVLPEPGSLEGVKSKGKRFLFLQDVSYTYPSSGAPAVRRASVECSLKSRVAIVGPNGAGKSTLAALVVGELQPDAGAAWRHPNLRVAFVAQHAFHHLEQHMELTATQYLLARFRGGEDHEAADLRAVEAEAEVLAAYRLEGGHLVACEPHDERAAQPEAVVARRQRGRLGYEYEVRWRGEEATTWLPGTQLAAMGHGALARREDERQAAQRSLNERPLTTPSVETHLAGFGLGAEDASHRRLSALSNGQRARVVLGAATWLAPHLLVLDEPTNYLDRPGLAALTAGLQSFGGGVLVISHTTSFLNEVCAERWIMVQGALRREGAPLTDALPEEEEAAAQKGVCAATLALKAAKDRKRLKRMKELRRKNGEQVSDDEEAWWQDLKGKAMAAR